MKISDRFTDYGLIGGFFWLLQYLTVVFVQDQHLSLTVKITLTMFNSLSAASLSMLGAIGVVAVFATGLLLDLAGYTLFRDYEVKTFAEQVRRNINWLNPFVHLNAAYIQSDVSQLVTASPLPDSIRSWSKHIRQISLFSRKREAPFAKPYIRISALFFSYVQLSPGADKLETFNAQISFLNMARAIATTFVTSTLVSFFYLNQPFYLNQLSRIRQPGYLFKSTELLASQLILIFISYYVSLVAYERVSSTLFAMLYVISQRDLKAQATPTIPDQPA